MINQHFKFTSVDSHLGNQLIQSKWFDNNSSTDEDIYPKIRDFLLESSLLYSNIGEWWDKSVKPGIKSGERICHFVTIDNEIAAISIGKRAKDSAKLCTLKVNEKYRGLGLGHQLLLKTLTQLTEMGCKRVHYTISEEIQNQCGSFFIPYRFRLVSWKNNHYSQGMEELVFAANADHLKSVIKDYWRQMWNNWILLSIKPEYASLIEQGHKQVEFRRKFSSKLTSSKAVFYVSSPIRELRFTANISSVVKSSPNLLWKQFEEQGGVDCKSFENYFADSKDGYALLLSDVKAMSECIHLHDSRLKSINFKPPQSFSFLNPESPIFQALPFLKGSK